MALRERRAAAAGAGGVGIDEIEALLHQRLLVVEGHAVQVDEALGVDEEADAVELVDAVAFARAGVELDAVREARAASAENAEA